MSEEKRNIVKEDLFRLKFIQGAALSPDGKKVVYILNRYKTEKKDEKEEIQDQKSLWLADLESSTERQFTSEKTGGGSPAWSPDSKQIAFISDREGSPQVYVIPVDGGEARKLTNMPQGVGGGPLWSPDGKQIAFTAGPKLEAPPDPKKPYRVDRNIYRFDGAGYLDPLVQDVYLIGAEGGEPRQLTADRFSYSLQEWSPDGQEILLLASSAPDTFSFRPALRILQVNGKLLDPLKNWGMMLAAAWTPDSKEIVFAGTPLEKPIGSKADLWKMRRHGSEPVCLTQSLKEGVLGGLQPDMPVMMPQKFFISPDGQKLYVEVQKGGTVHVYEVSLNGEESIKQLTKGDKGITLEGMAGGTLLCAVSETNNPVDLFTTDLQGSELKRLTSINSEFLQGLNLPALEHLLYPSVDGVQVEGWFMKPPEGQGPYPTVLYIHGGPHSAFGYAFSFDFQMLAGAGYGVLFINHRASTGYGDEFSTAIKGDWGNLDYQDLMYGVDYAIQKGLADPDKLGVCGLSGGGNLSCWIIGQTRRFKAAVPENPVANWNSFYGVSDIGVDFAVAELGGHPYEIPEIYEKCSPVTYAHTCTTPTLFVQGECDYRCPTEQSEQMYTILKANGCIAEMLRLPNSPHAGSIIGPVELRQAQNDALLDWMNRYLM